MASRPEEEQQFAFDFPTPDADDESGGGEEATALVARVEAVHAVATQRAMRRGRVPEEAWIDRLFGAAAPDDHTSEVESVVANTPPTEEMPTPPFEDEFEPATAEGPPEEARDDSLSVAQFYRQVRRALAGAFPDEVWVTGEIRGIRTARGGHRYFELADHGADAGGRIPQQLEVTCWARDWPTVAGALAEAGLDLEVGRVVRVRGKVSVWEGGGKLRFTLTALDIEALLGNIAAARRQLLHALEVEGLLEANRRLPVPLVPLRIGLVTSPGSEGHRDFAGQLARSGFNFEIHLEPSLVQGTEAPGQLAAALKRLEAYGPDLAVIVRGGGARGDLAAFDSEEVARAIATAPFPVWSGVGHTGDRSVADEVVNFSTITPTACGEAIVARVAQYYDEMRRRVGQLSSLARARLDSAKHRLSVRAGSLVNAAHRQLDHRERAVTTAVSSIGRHAERRIDAEQLALRRRATQLSVGATRRLTGDAGDLDRCRQVLTAYDPGRQLQRGWSLSHRPNGELLRSVRELAADDEMVTRLADGTVTSTVRATREDGSQ